MLLTGQRIGEAQRATWSHVLGDRWHIPKEHSKNHRAHWVTLSRQALALLRAQDASRELIFGTATDTGVQAWLRRWCERERISPAFRPHDLRRTCATRLNTLGVLPHVTEKILNHTMQGVMAVYNRADYEAERVDAMQRWANELDRTRRSMIQLTNAGWTALRSQTVTLKPLAVQCSGQYLAAAKEIPGPWRN